jgi:hypothetical protein
MPEPLVLHIILPDIGNRIGLFLRIHPAKAALRQKAAALKQGLRPEQDIYWISRSDVSRIAVKSISSF